MLTYKKVLLPYKQDLLTYIRKDLLTNTKRPRQIITLNSCAEFLRQIPLQIPTANSHDKFLLQIPTASSCGKFLCQIDNANSWGKFLRQILAADSHGKFLRQTPIANSRICNAKDGMVYPLSRRASHIKIKRKQVSSQKFFKT